ncbi:3-methyladenine DNA glycosylase [Rhodococcus sp. 14-2483-1-1]|uniref:DNA-3-methyladenine glycosylase n=1 Tax=unclassified Rhodococcus (in: high G+C Gram-positive bacteria) TaxID=192944 RepID=UPI000B9C0F2A|nr:MULTISPECIES: DNA-3-methyladenine glycosylase [unclassified Rhodococcus (in: high G+C Gram-positive bacteria)]OZC44916.1 3-methyladenine DNA glycosylase [Rhodococcus sp. WWJCD1]OZF32211.1 3-methyladenine DNA glycosylase [Rhodococcus sp. 14-2483-1-1]
MGWVNVADLESGDPDDAARRILGGTVHAGEVSLRIVEVEAYGGPLDGPWPDPAAHSFRGSTPRNEVMFGPAGRLYVYLSYGMHLCMNVSCGPDGTAAAVLLRAGEVVAGHDIVEGRRAGRSPRSARVEAGWGRGPGNLGRALGVSLADNGTELFDASSAVTLQLLPHPLPEQAVASGPRVGVSLAADRPWRFWIRGSSAVSSYKRSPRAAVPGGLEA